MAAQNVITHDVTLLEKKHVRDHGQVLSYGESGLTLNKELRITSFGKFSTEYPDLNVIRVCTLRLGAPASLDPKDRNKQLLDYLRQNLDRYAQIPNMNDLGQTGLLSPYVKEGDGSVGEESDGYIVHILPPPLNALGTSSNGAKEASIPRNLSGSSIADTSAAEQEEQNNMFDALMQGIGNASNGGPNGHMNGNENGNGNRKKSNLLNGGVDGTGEERVNKRVRIGEVQVKEITPNPTPANRGHEQLLAMQHYNENLNRDRSTRHLSLIFHLRNFNNCVKSHVISVAVKHMNRQNSSETVKVLDLGCGMGGDILKWLKGDWVIERYVGVDIAKASLSTFASERLNNIAPETRKKITHLICADLGFESLTNEAQELDTHIWVDDPPSDMAKEDSIGYSGEWIRLGAPLKTTDVFDIASSQFAMHYMFQTETKANNLFAEVSKHLSSGGIFVATTIDSRVILDLIVQQESQHVPNSKTSEIDKNRTLVFRNNFDDVLLEISFSADNWNKALVPPNTLDTLTASNKKNPDDSWAYGIEYTFALKDSDNASAVNAPEWLVPFDKPLQRLAERHNMRLVAVSNFHDIATDADNHAFFAGIKPKLETAGVFNTKNKFTDHEWQLAHLYAALAFVKI